MLYRHCSDRVASFQAQNNRYLPYEEHGSGNDVLSVVVHERGTVTAPRQAVERVVAFFAHGRRENGTEVGTIGNRRCSGELDSGALQSTTRSRNGQKPQGHPE
jgi:hypothetical protein